MTMNWGNLGQNWWGHNNPAMQTTLEGSDQGRQMLFAGGLSQFGLNGNRYNQAFKMYEPQFNKYLGYTANQLNSGAPNPSFTEFLNNNFDIRREMNKQPQQGRFAGPIRYY